MENSMSEPNPQTTQKTQTKVALSLEKDAARTDILNRLKRAEGQIRGIQRMLEQGEDCQIIAQQFSAARKALNSTYLRMTVCFAEQELESMMANGSTTAETKTVVLKDLETMLARLR
jgi:DNA-binding FrmR family transcriptional regulator